MIHVMRNDAASLGSPSFHNLIPFSDLSSSLPTHLIVSEAQKRA